MQVSRRAPIDPPALVRLDPRYDLDRCWCVHCRRLDKRHPGEGYQLTLFRMTEPEIAEAAARYRGQIASAFPALHWRMCP